MIIPVLFHHLKLIVLDLLFFFPGNEEDIKFRTVFDKIFNENFFDSTYFFIEYSPM